MSGDRIVPLQGCAHVFPVLSGPGVEPPTFGSCRYCGEPFKPLVLHCATCLKRIPPGVRECQTPQCMERSAALVAEWIAHGLFDGIDGEPS